MFGIRKKTKQKGQIMLFAMIILGIMISTSLAVGTIFIPKIRLSADTKNSTGALFAAESGLEWCLHKNQKSGTLPPPTMSNGATFVITPADCSGKILKVVGTYRGVARAFEATFP